MSVERPYSRNTYSSRGAFRSTEKAYEVLVSRKCVVCAESIERTKYADGRLQPLTYYVTRKICASKECKKTFCHINSIKQWQTNGLKLPEKFCTKCSKKINSREFTSEDNKRGKNTVSGLCYTCLKETGYFRHKAKLWWSKNKKRFPKEFYQNMAKLSHIKRYGLKK